MCLVALIIAELAWVGVLSRAGSLAFLQTPGVDLAGWRRWLMSTPPQDAVASVLRLVAMGCAWWLVAATALSLAARLSRIPSLVRAARWTTPSAIRLLVERAVALSFLATVAGGGAAFAGGAPPVPIPIPAPLFPAPPSPGPAVQRVPAPGQTPPQRHTVEKGDNLWSIAARHLAGNGAAVAERRVAPYWRDLVQQNRGGLRSGDPDLIFPGETVSLPPVP